MVALAPGGWKGAARLNRVGLPPLEIWALAPFSRPREGIEAAKELRRRHPGTGVVVLSQYDDPEYADAFVGPRRRHPDVRDDHFRGMFLDDGQQLRKIRGHPDHLEVGLGTDQP